MFMYTLVYLYVLRSTSSHIEDCDVCQGASEAVSVIQIQGAVIT